MKSNGVHHPLDTYKFYFHKFIGRLSEFDGKKATSPHLLLFSFETVLKSLFATKFCIVNIRKTINYSMKHVNMNYTSDCKD